MRQRNWNLSFTIKTLLYRKRATEDLIAPGTSFWDISCPKLEHLSTELPPRESRKVLFSKLANFKLAIAQGNKQIYSTSIAVAKVPLS